MEYRKFDYKDKTELLRDIGMLKKGLPFNDNIGPIADSIVVGDKSIKNRLLVQPMEGFDAELDGSPSKRTFERYLKFANGGSGTVWIESVSVNNEGRSNPHQLWLTKDNQQQFSRMIGDVKKYGAYVVVQLTHSGRYSNPAGNPLPLCAINNPYIPKQNETIISDEDLKILEYDYVNSALLAEEAGADAVDIRSCHGYLINELFSAYERGGEYGGCFENRARLLLNIIDKIKERTKIQIAVRLNVYDGIPYPNGWGGSREDVLTQDMKEPMKLLGLLYQRGIRFFNISSGIGAYSPHVLRPYNSGGATPPEHPLEGIERMLQSAKVIKKAFPDAVIVASAFSWLREYAPMVAAGGISDGWFDIAGFGRGALANPDYANEILSKKEISVLCRACGGCSSLIRKAEKLRCVMNASQRNDGEN